MLITLTGPSGSGKTSILRAMCKKGRATRIVTYTTREKRKREVEGIDYHFVEGEPDKRKVVAFTSFAGNFYWIDKKECTKAAKSEGYYCVVVDHVGAKTLKETYGDRVFNVFVTVPEEEAENRMIKRDGEKKTLIRVNHPDDAVLRDSVETYAYDIKGDFSNTKPKDTAEAIFASVEELRIIRKEAKQ
nr:MAG TPA: guanylate kinase [Caudoviricetes sp.]